MLVSETSQPINAAGSGHVAGDPTSRPPGRRPGARRWGTGAPRGRNVLLGLLGILAFLAFWEAASRLELVDSRYLPPASAVLVELLALLFTRALWTAIGHTMSAWIIGLTVAAVAAVVVGFIIGSSTFLRKVTNSTIEFLRPIPSVALIPLAVLLFGISREATLLLILYACFWQILIQVLYGVADVDTVARSTARSYGLRPLSRARYVVWPTTLPYLMTGFRLAGAVALILAVTAEMVIGSPGLGREIVLARSGVGAERLYALVVVAGLIGILINTLLRLLEQRTLAWHESVRKETRS